MKYFTLRGPPKHSFSDDKDKNGGTYFGGMNGDAHSSAHHQGKLSNQDTMQSVHPTSSHYFYAQPRQKQRPQLAQHFNLKSCNPKSRRSVVGNSNGIIEHGYNGVENGFVAPKSAPLPRKSYNAQNSSPQTHHEYNNVRQKKQEVYEENDFEYEGFAIPHNGTLPSKVRRRRQPSNDTSDVNENSSKLLFSPFQKLLNRQKVRGAPFNASKENMSSPEETENNVNHQLFHYHNQDNNNETNSKTNPEYGELREIVRRIEMQEQSKREAQQQYTKQVKHHPVILVQQRLHHATTLSPNNNNNDIMQNEFGSHFTSNGTVMNNGKGGQKVLSQNKKKNSAFNYLTDSLTQR